MLDDAVVANSAEDVWTLVKKERHGVRPGTAQAEAPRPEERGEAHNGKFLKRVTSKTYLTKTNKIEEVRTHVAVEEFLKL